MDGFVVFMKVLYFCVFYLIHGVLFVTVDVLSLDRSTRTLRQILVFETSEVLKTGALWNVQLAYDHANLPHHARLVQNKCRHSTFSTLEV